MLTNIIIPVINTENNDFEYKGELSRTNYDNLVMENFLQTDKQISQFLQNGCKTTTNINEINGYIPNNDISIPDVQYDECECEAFIQDSKKNDIAIDFFDAYRNNGNMFILIVNINPNTLNGDCESELKYWIDDSAKIQNDRDLDTETKLKILPPKNLKIKLGDITGELNDCKILQNYSDKKYPFHFAIIVNKIIY